MSYQFPIIRTLEDLQTQVNKPEIRFRKMPNGVTYACYMFSDDSTFDTSYARECRGIKFAPDGRIISRPLHKFFRLGENPQAVLTEAEYCASSVYEKLDGSMIATCDIDGKVQWCTKKDFDNEVCKIANKFLALEENKNIVEFGQACVDNGWTAIFELTTPEWQIVVKYPETRMRLLHVRDNVTGEYYTNSYGTPKYDEVWDLVFQHDIRMSAELAKFAGVCNGTLDPFLSSLVASMNDMQNEEGYIIQKQDGDMVKLKCPWYDKYHRVMTNLRERDVAKYCLTEEIDDVKAACAERGMDLTKINAIQTRVKNRLIEIEDEVMSTWEQTKVLSRRDYALLHKDNKYVPMLMLAYQGRDIGVVKFFTNNYLKAEFGLESLASQAFIESQE